MTRTHYMGITLCQVWKARKMENEIIKGDEKNHLYGGMQKSLKCNVLKIHLRLTFRGQYQHFN